MLFAATSLAYQHLEKWEKAEESIINSLNLLPNIEDTQNLSVETIQTLIFSKSIRGDLLKGQGQTESAEKSYAKALNLLKKHPHKTNPFQDKIPILTAANVESIHRNLLELIPIDSPNKAFRNKIRISLKEHLLAELDDLMKQEKWQEADLKNNDFIIYVGDRDEDGLEWEELEKFSCDDLKQLDDIWLKNSDNHYGYSVQKKILSRIYQEKGLERYSVDFKQAKLINSKDEVYLQFAEEIGWRKEGDWLLYSDRDEKMSYGGELQQGHLPTSLVEFKTSNISFLGVGC